MMIRYIIADTLTAPLALLRALLLILLLLLQAMKRWRWRGH